MLEVDRGHKYHPPIPSSPIATFRFCFLVHLLPQALFTAFGGVFWVLLISQLLQRGYISCRTYLSQRTIQQSTPARKPMKEKNQPQRWPYHKILFTRAGAEPLLGLCPPDLFPQPAITCASLDDGKLLLEARALICWPWSNKYIAGRKNKKPKCIFFLFP